MLCASHLCIATSHLEQNFHVLFFRETAQLPMHQKLVIFLYERDAKGFILDTTQKLKTVASPLETRRKGEKISRV